MQRRCTVCDTSILAIPAILTNPQVARNPTHPGGFVATHDSPLGPHLRTYLRIHNLGGRAIRP